MYSEKVMDHFANPRNVGELALSLSNKAVMEALDGLPPEKIHCSVLAEQAIKAAIDNYRARESGDAQSCTSCGTCCRKCADVGDAKEDK